MKKTQQIGSESKPGNNDNVMALILMCAKCDTQRAFKVSDAFMMTVNRIVSGCQYNASCEMCGHEVSVQLVWTRRHLGWTAEKITFSKAVTVEDEFLMVKTEGEKQI